MLAIHILKLNCCFCGLQRAISHRLNLQFIQQAHSGGILSSSINDKPVKIRNICCEVLVCTYSKAFHSIVLTLRAVKIHQVLFKKQHVLL